ncbi:hypothetical protein [Pedobacter gandavensis]|uniref:hypothetical protein n=1 Tax=Pedobacter gandavensis TaxID=2679963 RepID=UPI00292D6D2C|nr:hypothetical protein [Pedobacter gandavensis]
MEDTVQQQIRLSLLEMALANAVTIEDYEECQQLVSLELMQKSFDLMQQVHRPLSTAFVEAK